MDTVIAPTPVEASSETQSLALAALLGKILRREARVGVIGLGYVGLPLAADLAHAGFLVEGIRP
jgi:UDP-N-acetyl-D-glucosamine dehydrogenase